MHRSILGSENVVQFTLPVDKLFSFDQGAQEKAAEHILDRLRQSAGVEQT